MAATPNDFFGNVTRRLGEVADEGIKRAKAGFEGLRGAVTSNPAAQAAGDIAEGAGQRASQAVDAVGDAAQRGLRSSAAAVNPGAAEYRSWGAPSQAGGASPGFNELGPVQAEPAPAPAQSNVRSKYGDSFRANGGSSEAQAFRSSGAGANPTVTGNPDATKVPVKSGGFGSGLRATAKVLGTAGAVLGVADGVDKAMSGQTPEQLTGTGGAVQGGATEAYDNLAFGQGRKLAHGMKGAISGAVPSSNMGKLDMNTVGKPGVEPQYVQPEAPVGLRQRAGAIVSGFGKGWDEGAAMEKKAAGLSAGSPSFSAGNSAPAQAPHVQGELEGDSILRVPGTPGATMPAARPGWGQNGTSNMEANNGGQMPSLSTVQSSRDANGNLVIMNAAQTPVPVAQQQAAAAVQQQNAGLRVGRVQVPNAPIMDRTPAADPLGTRDGRAPQPGVFGEIAAMQGLRTADVSAQRKDNTNRFNTTESLKQQGQVLQSAAAQEQADVAREGHQVTREGNQLTAATAKARLGYEMGKDNKAGVEKSVANHVLSQIEAQKTGTLGVGGEKDADYQNRVKKETADVMGRLEHSVANRKDGRTVEGLPPAEREQLLLADRVRRKFDAGRADVVQNMRDFFGTKQFDSKDLYSYLPATDKAGKPVGAETSLLPGGGGIVMRAQNGNTMTATRGLGGDWNLITPNGPVDADVAALWKPHLEALEKKAKGSK